MIVLTGSQSKGSRSTERELYPKQVKFLFAEMRRGSALPRLHRRAASLLATSPWLMLRKRVRAGRSAVLHCSPKHPGFESRQRDYISSKEIMIK